MDNEVQLIIDGKGMAIIGESKSVERFLVSEGLPSKDLELPRLRSILSAGAGIDPLMAPDRNKVPSEQPCHAGPHDRSRLRDPGGHDLPREQGPDRRGHVVEDLHVAGMVRNHRLARHVQDAAFAEIRRHLTDKTTWHGGTLLVADRWFASSKTYSACGTVKTELALSEREYVCETCGTVLDRDANAAVNLARLAGSTSDSNGRGADQKTRSSGQAAVKRPPGTRQRGQTGSLPPQGESAA